MDVFPALDQCLVLEKLPSHWVECARLRVMLLGFSGHFPTPRLVVVVCLKLVFFWPVEKEQIAESRLDSEIFAFEVLGTVLLVYFENRQTLPLT